MAKVIFSTSEVASICKVTQRTVRKWIDSGRLEGYRAASSLNRYIPREALIRFMKENGMPLGNLESEQAGPEEQQ